MNNIKKTLGKCLSILALVVLSIPVSAQDNQKKVTLQIGDTAPPLKYSKWIKGSTVDITGDKIYVIELWATWCGPCIAAMPHLSALAKEYTGKVEFIGCNVAEAAFAEDKNKPYETYLPKVEKFVNGNTKRMEYHVIADNNAQDMLNGWLRAAGMAGIPCTFVVQHNRIMWIGNPNKLDNILAELEKGTYDLQAGKKKANEDNAEMKVMIQNQRESANAISAAMKVKDYDQALKLMDDYARFPYLRTTMKQEKFGTLLYYFSEEKAMDYAREELKVSNECASLFAITILRQEGLSPKAYGFAAEWYNMEQPSNAFIKDKVAEAYLKSGNVKAAVAAEKEAVALAKEEMKDPEWEGKILNSHIADFEAKVKKYESRL